MAFYVYMLASGRNGTLYVGQTDDILARVHQHREKTFKGFTATYGIAKLVWLETHEERDLVLLRERQIKKWYRAWKLRTIEESNPDWRDLYDDLISPGHPLHPDLRAWAVEQHMRLEPRIRGDERG